MNFPLSFSNRIRSGKITESRALTEKSLVLSFQVRNSAPRNESRSTVVSELVLNKSSSSESKELSDPFWASASMLLDDAGGLKSASRLSEALVFSRGLAASGVPNSASTSAFSDLVIAVSVGILVETARPIAGCSIVSPESKLGVAGSRLLNKSFRSFLSAGGFISGVAGAGSVPNKSSRPLVGAGTDGAGSDGAGAAGSAILGASPKRSSIGGAALEAGAAGAGLKRSLGAGVGVGVGAAGSPKRSSIPAGGVAAGGAAGFSIGTSGSTAGTRGASAGGAVLNKSSAGAGLAGAAGAGLSKGDGDGSTGAAGAMGAGSGVSGETIGTAEGGGAAGAGAGGVMLSDGVAGRLAAGTPHPQSGTSITAGEASHPQIDAGSTAID